MYNKSEIQMHSEISFLAKSYIFNKMIQISTTNQFH